MKSQENEGKKSLPSSDFNTQLRAAFDKIPQEQRRKLLLWACIAFAGMLMLNLLNILL